MVFFASVAAAAAAAGVSPELETSVLLPSKKISYRTYEHDEHSSSQQQCRQSKAKQKEMRRPEIAERKSRKKKKQARLDEGPSIRLKSGGPRACERMCVLKR